MKSKKINLKSIVNCVKSLNNAENVSIHYNNEHLSFTQLYQQLDCNGNNDFLFFGEALEENYNFRINLQKCYCLKNSEDLVLVKLTDGTEVVITMDT